MIIGEKEKLTRLKVKGDLYCPQKQCQDLVLIL